MSDTNNSVVKYSSFWPQLILMVGLTIWCSYQLYAVNRQRMAIKQQYEALAPVVKQAVNAREKLYAVAQDLIQISAKDPYAAQIVKEANMKLTPNPAAKGTSAPAPAPAK